ncbi:hypothetical protein SDC9_206960 [bioreactor metagenome]|uniref:Uncharacterized protein n=1 Tax=bioreactor metagenome TaxID=1076179 RepID=A0A645J953_9ZZZZ
MLLLRREYALPGPFFKEIFGTCSRAELAFLAEQIGCLAGVEPQSPDVEFAAATLFSQLNMLALDKNLMSQVIPDLIEYTGTHPDWLTEKLLRQLNSIVKA